MPNWKKLVTSGSDASLNSINVETFVSASSFIGDGSGLTGVTSYTDTDTLNFLNSINALSGSALQDAIDTEKARIDAILLSAGADTDSFAEIVSLINSIDTDNDTAFASFYTASNERIGAIESFTSSLENNTLISSSAQIASDISGSFVAASSSIASEIVTLNTFSSSLDTTILNLTGSFTGDGSGLSGITVSEAATVSEEVSNVTTTVVVHNFGSYNVIITAYDDNRRQVIPQSVTLTDLNTATVTFCDTFTGTLVVGKGGHIVSGTIATEIVEEATVVDTFTDVSTYTVTHNFDSKNIIVSVYNNEDAQIIPKSVVTTTNNTVTVTFCEDTSGRVIVAKGGHIVSGSSQAVIDLSTVDQHIIPVTDNTYDLGSPTKQWRDLYLSSASLYIDGTIVISSNTDTLTFTTDAGQSIKLLEAGGDDITLQTDTGNIELKGTVEIESGKKITDSAGTMINFGDSIAVTGSIETTGTVDGIDLQAFSSSVAAGFANTTADYTELTNIPAGIVSSSSQITITESQISDLTHYTDSDVKIKLNSEGVVSGSSQVDYTSIQNTPTTITAQQASDITTNNAKVGYTDSLVKTKLNTENVVSGSSQITTLLNGEDLTLANLTVNGTQTILDSTRLAIGDNIIELNGGGATNGGLLIKDVTAPNSVSGSLLWDSTNDYWIGGPLGSEQRVVLNGDTPSLAGLTTTGNVGIGTDNPTEKLEVNGTGRFTNSSTAIGIILNRGLDVNVVGDAGVGMKMGALDGTTYKEGATIYGTLKTNGDDGEFTVQVRKANVMQSRLTIDEDGNVGIGTSSPSYKLDVNSGADNIGIAVTSTDANSFISFKDNTTVSHGRVAIGASGEDLTIFTEGTEKLRIDSSGNVGIGIESPSATLDVADTAPTLRITNTKTTLLQEVVGSIEFFTKDTTVGASRILSSIVCDSQTTSSNPEGNLIFKTTIGGSAGVGLEAAEKMRIDSSGNVQIGAGSRFGKFDILDVGGSGSNFIIGAAANGDNYYTTGTSGIHVFRSGTSERIRITSGGNVGIGTTSPSTKLQVEGTVTATALTETSALRFKENIQEDIDTSIIDKLRPVSYDWKESKEKDYGFIAEEVNKLDSVLTTENEDGEMLGIKYTKLIPFLVKKIQEQEERIKQLENGNS